MSIAPAQTDHGKCRIVPIWDISYPTMSQSQFRVGFKLLLEGINLNEKNRSECKVNVLDCNNLILETPNQQHRTTTIVVVGTTEYSTLIPSKLFRME